MIWWSFDLISVIFNSTFLGSLSEWVTLSAADRGSLGSGRTLCTTTSVKVGSTTRHSRFCTLLQTKWVKEERVDIFIYFCRWNNIRTTLYFLFFSGDPRKSRESLLDRVRPRIWERQKETTGILGHALEDRRRGRQQDEPPGHPRGSGHLYVQGQWSQRKLEETVFKVHQSIFCTIKIKRKKW